MQEIEHSPSSLIRRNTYTVPMIMEIWRLVMMMREMVFIFVYSLVNYKFKHDKHLGVWTYFYFGYSFKLKQAYAYIRYQD